MSTKTKSAAPTAAVANVPAPTQAIAIAEKPLGSAQMKTLQKLVDTDFDDLRGQLLNEINQRSSRRLQEVKKECQSNDEKVSAITRMVTEYVILEVAKLESKVRSMVAKAGGEVVVPQIVTTGVQNNGISAGKTVYAAESEVRAATQRIIQQLGTTVNREHRKVTRLILLQGITHSGAVDMIANLPQPQSIYALVQAETAETHGDDIATLMGTKASIINLLVAD